MKIIVGGITIDTTKENVEIQFENQWEKNEFAYNVMYATNGNVILSANKEKEIEVATTNKIKNLLSAV